MTVVIVVVPPLQALVKHPRRHLFGHLLACLRHANATWRLLRVIQRIQAWTRKTARMDWARGHASMIELADVPVVSLALNTSEWMDAAEGSSQHIVAIRRATSSVQPLLINLTLFSAANTHEALLTSRSTCFVTDGC